MNQPIEREGLLYDVDELRRYFELPAEDPDAIIGICDTKDKGSDYAFLPAAYVYGNDYYIDDCVCDNSLPNIVDARLVDMVVLPAAHGAIPKLTLCASRWSTAVVFSPLFLTVAMPRLTTVSRNPSCRCSSTSRAVFAIVRHGG